MAPATATIKLTIEQRELSGLFYDEACDHPGESLKKICKRVLRQTSFPKTPNGHRFEQELRRAYDLARPSAPRKSVTPMLLGLGGSAKHVMGHEGATSTYSRSSTPALVDALCRGIETGRFDRFYPKEEREEDEIHRAIAIAQHYLRPPTQNLEFFAKTLMVGDIIRVEQHIACLSQMV